MQWLLWFVALLGLWLIVAPFTVGAAMWNEVTVGLIVAGCAGWAAWTQRTTQKA